MKNASAKPLRKNLQSLYHRGTKRKTGYVLCSLKKQGRTIYISNHQASHRQNTIATFFTDNTSHMLSKIALSEESCKLRKIFKGKFLTLCFVEELLRFWSRL